MKMLVALVFLLVPTGEIVAAPTTLPPGSSKHGAVVFKQCAVCHKIGPHAQNSVGPVLTGVVGRHAARYPGYSYSSAMKKSGIVWNAASLSQFLHAPRKFVPGTRMGFLGLNRKQDVADVIAYLKTFEAVGNGTIEQSD